MEFDFEGNMDGPPQAEGIPPDRQILLHQSDVRNQGYDAANEQLAGPMDPGRAFDSGAQQPQQQPAGPSSQSLREAREAGGQVYIANLTWWTTDADVEAVCSSFGPVSGLQFVEDRSNGRSKGVVLVEFSDPEAAARCKEQLSGKPINGRSCVVTFVTSGKPGASSRAGGPTPPPGMSLQGGGGGVPGMGEGRSGGRGGYGGRGGRGGRSGRGGERGGDRDRDRGHGGVAGGGGGGGFGGPPGPMPPDMPPPSLSMPPLAPSMGPMAGLPHAGGAFLGAMAANPLALLPAMMGGGMAGGLGMGVGVGGVPGGLGGLAGGHPGMGGPHGHPLGGPGGHFMADM